MIYKKEKKEKPWSESESDLSNKGTDPKDFFYPP